MTVNRLLYAWKVTAVAAGLASVLCWATPADAADAMKSTSVSIGPTVAAQGSTAPGGAERVVFSGQVTLKSRLALDPDFGESKWLLLIERVARKVGLLGARDRATREGHSRFLTIGNEPTGRWMKNSATDNPRFLAATMETFLGWTVAQPQKGYAQARPIEIGNGQYAFQNGCAACHTVGQGDKIGPDLLAVTERRQRDWLTRYLLVPDEVRAAGDPTAAGLFAKYKVKMPNLGLARDEVADLLAYIKASTARVRARSTASR